MMNENNKSDELKSKRTPTMAERKAMEDAKIINAIEDNKNEKRAKWSNMNDIENKLVVLSELNKRVQSREQKMKVMNLMDAYEKQMKKLIIEKTQRNNGKNKGYNYEQYYMQNNKRSMEQA